jgi:hypothetical protein
MRCMATGGANKKGVRARHRNTVRGRLCPTRPPLAGMNLSCGTAPLLSCAWFSKRDAKNDWSTACLAESVGYMRRTRKGPSFGAEIWASLVRLQQNEAQGLCVFLLGSPRWSREGGTKNVFARSGLPQRFLPRGSHRRATVQCAALIAPYIEGCRPNRRAQSRQGTAPQVRRCNALRLLHPTRKAADPTVGRNPRRALRRTMPDTRCALVTMPA